MKGGEMRKNMKRKRGSVARKPRRMFLLNISSRGDRPVTELFTCWWVLTRSLISFLSLSIWMLRSSLFRRHWIRSRFMYSEKFCLLHNCVLILVINNAIKCYICSCRQSAARQILEALQLAVTSVEAYSEQEDVEKVFAYINKLSQDSGKYGCAELCRRTVQLLFHSIFFYCRVSTW